MVFVLKSHLQARAARAQIIPLQVLGMNIIANNLVKIY